MYISTWPSATLMHPYVQVNANKHDSHMPRVPDARNLAFTEQTKQPGTRRLGAELKKNVKTSGIWV